MPQDKDELLQVLITKYAQMYMKLAYAIGVPYDDVEDIVMEAFCNMIRFLPCFRLSMRVVMRFLNRMSIRNMTTRLQEAAVIWVCMRANPVFMRIF